MNLAKIVKKTFSTTSVYGYGGFGEAFNGNSTQLKKMGGLRLLRTFFSSVRYSGLNAPVRTYRRCPGVVEGKCTEPLRYKTAPGIVLVIQCTGPFYVVLGFERCP